MSDPTAFGISTTSTLTNLSALTVPIPDPRSPFQAYAEYVTMASGKVVGRGWPIVTWDFGYLTQTQRDQLRTFCAGASAQVYIGTRQNDNADAYKKYQCVMNWPLNEERDATRRVSIKIVFTHCVLAA